MQIGVMGATGPAGGALAARLAGLGYDVVAGSRDPARARAAVDELRGRWGDRVDGLRAGANADAAEAELVVIGVQWEGAVETVAQHAAALSGKVVVSMANALTKVGREFHPIVPAEGSLALAMQKIAPEAHIATAFQHIPAAALADLDRAVECDVVVTADDDAARDTVLDLVAAIPDLRPFDAGSLANAVGIEAFTATLLSVNLRHKGRSSLRLVGVEPKSRDDR
jgi:8-hydroxy-5-deazaflavin:NADPH oxidoreductase